MGLRQLAIECKGTKSCPGVWVDDESPDDVIVIGLTLEPSPVPLGAGETAVRLRRQTVADAGLGV